MTQSHFVCPTTVEGATWTSVMLQRGGRSNQLALRHALLCRDRDKRPTLPTLLLGRFAEQ
eukprot:2268705-Amphidinium_carterae.1